MKEILSYSQIGDDEDIILYRLLGKINEPIHWVDVGANEPVINSVTKFFSNRGGTGVNIEPQRDLFDKLEKDRPDDINLQCGISDTVGELDLYGSGGLASFDKNNSVVAGEGKNKVRVITLSDVWNKYVEGKYDTIHFLKIDVEGWEQQVLNGMDFALYRPWVICIESTLPLSTTECYDKWENLILDKEYKFLGVYGVNRYYAAKEVLTELNSFPDRPLEKYYVIRRNSDINNNHEISVDYFSKIRYTIQSEIEKGIRNFAIFPYNKFGIMAEMILEKCFDKKALIIDNGLSRFNDHLYTFQEAKIIMEQEADDYVLIVASLNNAVIEAAYNSGFKSIINILE